MLLRSITKHVKEQNWFAVLLDFFIVVVGILIAFQITNWNEARSDARDEAALNIRFMEEFTVLEELLEERIVRAERITTSTSKLIDMIRVDESADVVPDVKQILIDAFRYNAQVPQPTTYSEAIQSGRIGKIGNEKLRQVLNEYNLSTEWWNTVRGAASPQNDPNSKLRQAVSVQSGIKEPSFEILDYNWTILRQAEKELSVIQRQQALQAEGYRLELIAVKNVLVELENVQ